jgi:signal transduction histidine kinase
MPKILIADDDPSTRNLIRRTLSMEQADYIFVEATNGAAALELALQEKPDILLLDVMMPEMTGLELCGILKSREDTRPIPVILVTALKESEDRIKGIEAGGDDFLAKPFDVLELRLRVKSLLRIKLLHDELQQKYEELQTANAELHRLGQLKDDLTNMIIHDMRTPLSSIQLGLQFVLYNSPDLPEMQRKTLGIAHTSMSQLTKMVNDLLDINRMEQGNVVLNKQTFSLHHVVQQRFEELETLAALDEKRFTADIPDDLPSLQADRDLVARVLGNLLSNALRYAPAQTVIAVSAKVTTDGNGVQISVHNDGRPIPHEYQTAVFEKFHQLELKRASGQGVGLGLAFCKMAVEAHRGRIWVESEEGRGTTFHFTLPLSD